MKILISKIFVSNIWLCVHFNFRSFYRKIKPCILGGYVPDYTNRPNPYPRYDCVLSLLDWYWFSFLLIHVEQQ